MKKIITLILAISLIFVIPINGFADGDGFLGYEMFEISDAQDNYEQKVTENGEGDGWKWDAATKTLTLCGINNGSFYPYHIYNKNDCITIVLEDGTVNRISGNFMLNGCDYVIKGNGELILEQATGALYDDEGNYLVDENGYGIYGPVPNLVDWNTTVTIESGTITGIERGIHLQGRLIINGGTLKLGCGIYGGIQNDVYKVVFNNGKLITVLPTMKNLKFYTSAKSAFSLYQQSPDVVLKSGLEPCEVTDKDGSPLIWKQTEDDDGFMCLNLYDQNGNYATYAEFTPADCYTKTGEKASDWAHESYYKAFESGIIPEESMYNFYSTSYSGADLTRNITRVEFTAIIVKLYEKLSGQNLETEEMPFDDVEYANDEYYISKAYNAGLIYGVSDTEFAPNSFLTREQAAVIFSRIFAKLVGDIPSANTALFADDNEISDWAKDAVYFMTEKGILQGMGENIFAPKSNTQMQQAIAIAAKLIDMPDFSH